MLPYEQTCSYSSWHPILRVCSDIAALRLNTCASADGNTPAFVTIRSAYSSSASNLYQVPGTYLKYAVFVSGT